MSALDAIAAAMLFVVGVYLLDPAAFDAGVYVEAGRYAWPGAFFVYSAALLLIASVAGFRPGRGGLSGAVEMLAIGTPALLTVACLDLVLGVQALFFVAPRPLVGLLIVPGLLALISTGFGEAAKADARAVRPRTTGDSGKTPEGGLDAGAMLRLAIGGALLSFALVVYVGGGTFLYYLLEAVLIDDVDLDMQRLTGVVLPDLFERLWPLAAALAAVSFVMMPLAAGLVLWLTQAAARRRPDLDRDLSEDEIAFVSGVVSDVEAHVERQGYRALARRVARTGWLLFLIGAGAGLWGMFAYEDIVAAVAAPVSDGWSLYVVDGRVLLVPILFGAMLLSLVPGAVAALLSRRRGEAGGLIMLGGAERVAAVEAQIVRLVRTRKLAPATPFDAGAFLWSAGAGYSAVVVIAAALSLGAFAIVWPHDRAVDTLYTDTGIETGDFWTMTRTAHPYASVEAVRLACAIDDDGATHVDYVVALPGGVSRSLVNQNWLAAKLDDYLKVDEKLRVAGARFAFVVPEEAASTDGLIERGCVVALSEGMDEAGRETIERLFHLEEWFERRWRARTRPPPPPRVSER